MAKDYYKILGVSKSATADEIKKSFRRLAMKYHPDRNSGDKSAEEKFKEAKEAYDVLSDTQKRATYDRFGDAGPFYSTGGGPGAGFEGGAPFNFEEVFGDLGDIFGDILGGGRGRRAQTASQRGNDLEQILSITLEEAALGTTKQVSITTQGVCSECGGKGAKKGTSTRTCQECSGTGYVRLQQGFFSVQQTCPVCHGRGQIIGEPCPSCNGQGRKRVTKTLSVKVPAGINRGDRIRLSGEGEAGLRGGPAGDLYIAIDVKEHPIFKRKDQDLLCEMPISFATATLGGEVEVPTLEGPVSLKIPAETQTGKVFKLRGKGIKSIRSGIKGDILCQVIVETPIKLNKQQKSLLEELEKSLSYDKVDHHPQSKSFFVKVKQFVDNWLHSAS